MNTDMPDDASRGDGAAEQIDADAPLSPAQAPATDEAVLRRKLIRRSLVAGALMAALAVGLVWMQFHSEGEETESAPTVTPPVAEAPPGAIEAPAKPAVPAVTAAPAPQPAAATAETRAPPAASAAAPATVAAAPALDTAAAPTVAEQVPAKAGPAASPAVPAAAAKTLAPERGYRVQVGVFNNIENAQQLQQRLAEAGVPALIETRVQAGPFATRREAEHARAKLRELGLGHGMLLPPSRPHKK